ncbi:MAG: hypothetical protein PHW82_05350 [Bacteroidales bacterium]|nr:hypothetical protein [Bacteroidales bacterium]
MLETDIEQIKNIHFTPKLINGETLYGFCTALVKKNLFNYVFSLSKENYWLGFSTFGIHHYRLDAKDNPIDYKLYNWNDIDDVLFRFAGSQASFCFMYKKENKCKYLLCIKEKPDCIHLDKKAIVFLMMKGSK